MQCLGNDVLYFASVMAAHTHLPIFLIVLGPVDPTELGRTLTHEHIMVDTSKYLTPPEYGSCNMEDMDFDLCHLGKIRHFP